VLGNMSVKALRATRNIERNLHFAGSSGGVENPTGHWRYPVGLLAVVALTRQAIRGEREGLGPFTAIPPSALCKLQVRALNTPDELKEALEDPRGVGPEVDHRPNRSIRPEPPRFSGVESRCTSGVALSRGPRA
jgi:hypothetical protein